MKENLKSKLGLGVALMLLGIILVFGGNNTLKKNLYTFADEPIRIEGFSLNTSQEVNIPINIIIPSVSINLDVKEARIVDGYWEVFEDTAGWGQGSGVPGSLGNQVIFAHAREGLFLPLKEVQVNDEIFVLTEGGWFGYKVNEIKEVFPDQVEVIAPTEDEILTLYTCSGFNDSMRLIVTAKRIIE
jgi:LPXTG-site transpeptidase (sortase) family protein